MAPAQNRLSDYQRVRQRALSVHGAPSAVDVLDGLREKPKRLPCRLLYDEIGATLAQRGWTLTQVFTAMEQPMRLWLCEPRGV